MVKPPPPAYLSQLFLGFLTRDTIFASLITYCDMFLVCCSRRSLESTLNKNLVSNHMPPCTTVYGTGDENSQVNIGLLPDTQNWSECHSLKNAAARICSINAAARSWANFRQRSQSSNSKYYRQYGSPKAQ